MTALRVWAAVSLVVALVAFLVNWLNALDYWPGWRGRYFHWVWGVPLAIVAGLAWLPTFVFLAYCVARYRGHARAG